ncbi:hypothetical protein D8B26_003004 [Coccidioides posadasii str. Silveira]|uniref:Uncharacterized protein n=2 Tax=Coccidioides posadasii TaxID=199306 RepID=E9CXI4_COCPS|nr:conserved hypothetical protein [Coccidioides posadasii str. Silveira]KMM72779.1 hypothetical protein CPAG_09071 [Coccidioides posadasii RMSCC 3488]QVM08312.1 hypothetical protein D8B26_003004 [Coccidioides posadasii str. Silveira]
MPTYRVEEASTGRAGCKNTECQQKKEKILKGELRLGSWVDTEQFQSWSWKHWGCVTPRQVASLQEIVGDDKDFSLLDGFDELSAQNQDKIREAVEKGHVSDSDWRGDVEVNRPGKTGFRVRVSKKKAAAGADGEADAKKAKADTPKKTKRSRGKKGDAGSEVEADGEPTPKKAKTAAPKKKSGKAEQASDAGTEQAETPKARRKSTGGPKKPEAEPKASKVTESKRPRKSAEKGGPTTTRVTRSRARAG